MTFKESDEEMDEYIVLECKDQTSTNTELIIFHFLPLASTTSLTHPTLQTHPFLLKMRLVHTGLLVVLDSKLELNLHMSLCATNCNVSGRTSNSNTRLHESYFKHKHRPPHQNTGEASPAR